MAEPGEALFRVGDREILMNGLYTHYCLVGPTWNKHIAIGYDPGNDCSKWLSPGVRGIMALITPNRALADVFKIDKPFIGFAGGSIGFDLHYRPTPEQERILENWDEEFERAGMGGPQVPQEVIDSFDAGE